MSVDYANQHNFLLFTRFVYDCNKNVFTFFIKMISDFKRYFTSFLMYTLTPPAFDVDHYAQNGNFYFKLVDIGSI